MIIEFSHTKKIAINAVLASVSIWLAFVSHYLAIPFVPMLKIDISDAPIFVSSMLFGFYDGALMLFVVSFIRTIFFSIAGWTGFVMRMVSLVSILFLGIYHKKNKNFIFYAFLAILFSVIIKIPVSYLFWTKIHFMPSEFIKSIMLPIIIPYNLIKNIINILITCFFIKKSNFNKIYKIC